MAHNLADGFDAVVMLTWSDWHSEPRSNRYHFATRFSKMLPVFFVQLKNGIEHAEIEVLTEYNIVIIHINASYGRKQSELLSSVLLEHGVRRPLLWIYNCFFEDFIRFYPAQLRVYHATEDYFCMDDSWTVAGVTLQHQLRRVLIETDLLVTVSTGVAQSYRDSGGYRGASILLRNGCDFEFWQQSGAFQFITPDGGRNTAFFQGVINERLDFDLLQGLVQAMPEWQFWFCGENVQPPGWLELAKMPNVKDFGFVSPSEIARLAQHSVVGLIPYKQGQLVARSLPLKAYEYVACGLPVITVPIVDLTARPDLFEQARTVEEFRKAIAAAVPTRTDPSLIELRLRAGRAESYDRRFEELQDALFRTLESRGQKRVRGNVLMLYECRSMQSRNNFDELEDFRNHSKHNVLFFDIDYFTTSNKTEENTGFEYYDAIIMHSSVFASSRAVPLSGFGMALRRYTGLKLLLTLEQSSFQKAAREWLEDFGIDAAIVGPSERSFKLNQLEERFPRVDFLEIPSEGSLDERAATVDRYIDRRLKGRVRARLVSLNVPVLAAFGSQGSLEPIWTPAMIRGWSMDAGAGTWNDTDTRSAAFAIIHEAIAQRAAEEKTKEPRATRPSEISVTPSLSMIAALSLRRIWLALPLRMRSAVGAALEESKRAGGSSGRSVRSRALGAGWRLLPRKIRQILVKRL